MGGGASVVVRVDIRGAKSHAGMLDNDDGGGGVVVKESFVAMYCNLI